jgi:hypothetical protein
VLLFSTSFSFPSILQLLSNYSLPHILVFAAQMLMDYISGRLGGLNDIKLASKIVRVIVAGNSVVTSDVTKGKDRLVGDFLHSFLTIFNYLFICLLLVNFSVQQYLKLNLFSNYHFH